MENTDNIIAFTKVNLPFGWLGNMAPYTIDWKGKQWRTSEAFFQAMRFKDEEAQIQIWREKSPMGAKMTAKRYADRFWIQPRSPADLRLMELTLRLKLTQHEELKKELYNTDGKWIIEDCSNRRNDSGLFWGAANVDGVWVGRNELGLMWMRLRQEIINHHFGFEDLEKMYESLTNP